MVTMAAGQICRGRLAEYEWRSRMFVVMQTQTRHRIIILPLICILLKKRKRYSDLYAVSFKSLAKTVCQMGPLLRFSGNY